MHLTYAKLLAIVMHENMKLGDNTKMTASKCPCLTLSRANVMLDAKILLVPTHQLIVPSTLLQLASATEIRTHKATEINTLKPLTYELFFQNSSTSNIHVTFYAPGWHIKMVYTNGRLDSLLYHCYQNTSEWIVFARLSSVDETKLPFAPLCISVADSKQLTNWLRNYIIVPMVIVRFLWRIVLFNQWYN